jgi:hypothetical protein
MMTEILPEKWMKGVAVTTTVLAVLTAIASSRAGFCVAKNQVLTALEGSQWAFYQAKSIKQNLAETQKNAFEIAALGATTPEQRTLLESTLREYTAQIARYDQEKNKIRSDAEKVSVDNLTVSRRGNQFSMAVVFFQIGIMLSSVGALLKRREMWYVGLVFGCVAIVYLANGLFLFF